MAESPQRVQPSGEGAAQPADSPRGTSGSAAPLTDRPRADVDAVASNVAMAEKILALPVQPHRDGGYVVRVLEVRGRRSGGSTGCPSPSPSATGLATLSHPEPTDPGHATLAADEEEIDVLRLYVNRLRWAGEQFPFSPEAPREDVREHLAAVAVYRLDPPATGS